LHQEHHIMAGASDMEQRGISYISFPGNTSVLDFQTVMAVLRCSHF